MSSLHLDARSIIGLINKLGVGQSEILKENFVLKMPEQKMVIALKTFHADVLDVEIEGMKVQVNNLSLTPEGLSLKFKLS